MSSDPQYPLPPTFDRRELFSWAAHGLGAAAALQLLSRDRTLGAAPIPGEAGDPCPHFAPKAKRAIHIYLCGGLSHTDSFDYKPELAALHGKTLTSSERPDVFFGQVGLLHKPFYEFKQRGQSDCGSRSCFRVSPPWRMS